ncbi:MAG: thiamine pyrophosphate-dependent enzyme, partial [Paramuribaculum sp.]
DEAASAPQQLTTAAAHGPAPMTSLRYRIQVYPADCTGCGSCATICPGKALTMTPIRQVMDQEKESLAYLQTKVTEKTTPIARDTVKGSQMHRPLLQFSGSCAGCGETPYVKLLTQLMGERLLIANATGCSSIWGANYPSNAYCTDSNGHGPAWGNSLFEDNAEYGYGMACAMTSRRNRLADVAKEIAADATTPAAVKTAAQAWLDAFDSFDGSASAGRSLVEALKSQPANPLYTDIIDRADMLGRKSVWAIGGDGWAYDIGFGGLDHVLAQKTDINVLVMDTECYSNTGGQTSKATPLGAVMKYAADGKRTPKKDLGRMMMTYGNIYVASVALGANYEQTINALAEAEAYPGPSIVIAYCPCINHGIRSGMSHSIVEQRLAVQSGYWPLYRFNPSLDTPLSVDAAAPDGSLIQFINGEDRYADLRMIDPAEAAILQPDLQKRTARIYSIIKAQSTGNLF